MAIGIVIGIFIGSFVAVGIIAFLNKGGDE